MNPAERDAVGAFLGPLLDALERITWVQRHLHPPAASRLAAALEPGPGELTAALTSLRAHAWPDDLGFVRDRLVAVAQQTLDLLGAFVEAARSPGDAMGLYRALRRLAGIQEALYPLAPVLSPVSRWFLEPARREDDALVAALREAARREDDPRVGVLHADHERGRRGGFSLYVPELLDLRSARPLVVALHGGHGHGRDFLWSWLREARSRGALVLAPTSRDRTWSIMGGLDVDAEPLRGMVE